MHIELPHQCSLYEKFYEETVAQGEVLSFPTRKYCIYRRCLSSDNLAWSRWIVHFERALAGRSTEKYVKGNYDEMGRKDHEFMRERDGLEPLMNLVLLIVAEVRHFFSLILTRVATSDFRFPYSLSWSFPLQQPHNATQNCKYSEIYFMLKEVSWWAACAWLDGIKARLSEMSRLGVRVGHKGCPIAGELLHGLLKVCSYRLLTLMS